MVELGPFTQHTFHRQTGQHGRTNILSAYIGSGYTSYLMTPIMHTTLILPQPFAQGSP
jgi:hypothetical protein